MAALAQVTMDRITQESIGTNNQSQVAGVNPASGEAASMLDGPYGYDRRRYSLSFHRPLRLNRP